MRFSDPDWIQTNDLLLRRQLLYSTELPGLTGAQNNEKTTRQAKLNGINWQKSGLRLSLYPMTTPAILLRTCYGIVFIFLTWLALATRSHQQWFHPLIVTYGGDIIWAGMFLFFLRMIFLKTPLWKLALVNYALGVGDELTQLYRAPWANAVRSTTIGRLLFGVGFLWSDILCYAIGTLLAFALIWLVERKLLPVSR